MRIRGALCSLQKRCRRLRTVALRLTWAWQGTRPRLHLCITPWSPDPRIVGVWDSQGEPPPTVRLWAIQGHPPVLSSDDMRNLLVQGETSGTKQTASIGMPGFAHAIQGIVPQKTVAVPAVSFRAGRSQRHASGALRAPRSPVNSSRAFFPRLLAPGGVRRC